MQIFKLFMKVLRKKIFTALIFVIVFVAISIPMAKNSTTEKAFKDTRLKITVFDDDNTPESRALTDMIYSKHKRVDIERDKEAMTEALYFEVTNYVLVINKGYSEKLAAGETDGLLTSYHIHEWFSVVLTDQLLDSYISSVNAYTAAGCDLSEAVEKAGEAVADETEVNYTSFNKQSDFGRSAGGYFSYLPYILISVVISALCPVLITLNKKEVRFRTNCSSIRPSSYTMQVFAGSAVFVSAVWLFIMVIGTVFIKGSIYSGTEWLAVLNSLIFMLVATAMAMLICSFTPTENVLNIITQVLSLGMSFTCGIFVPQSMLGAGVLSFARFLPAFWYVKANDMLCGKEAFDSSKLAGYLLIEFGFAVVMILITLLIHKLRYNSAKPAVRSKSSELRAQN
ncbi:MAG: ABC transporter permease [Ruminococcus sp.]|nr:ABC transporter permease [Ruminococcus sp.]